MLKNGGIYSMKGKKYYYFVCVDTSNCNYVYGHYVYFLREIATQDAICQILADPKDFMYFTKYPYSYLEEENDGYLGQIPNALLTRFQERLHEQGLKK